jgi:hypothetical protein
VLLFISNSNQRLPKHDWQLIWVITLSIVVITISIWESFWRLRGFEPSLNDDAQLWISIRRSIPPNDPSAVVLMGSSRMQLDFDTQVFKQYTNLTPFQLAIDGTSPLPVLAHFADDASFRGTIICDINEANLIAKQTPSVADQWIKAYQHSKFNAEFEFLLNSFVQETFVFRLPELQPINIWQNITNTGHLPLPFYLKLHADRFKAGDYLLLNKYPNYSIAAHYNMRLERHKGMYEGLLPVDQAIFESNLQNIQSQVQKIQQRGGKVVFVRFPTSGGILELDEQLLPREQYWNVFAQRVSAIFLHFKDYPDLQYNLPDGSHLDYRQAVLFTKSLTRLLMNSLHLTTS